MKNEPTLIEYAVFFGSIQIFQYLRINNVDLTPSLWFYAIHSNNPELIHILEENKVKAPRGDNYEACFEEAIKCHHNNIAYYIESNLITHKKPADKIKFDDKIVELAFSNYNYSFIPDNCKTNNSFFYLCKFDYKEIVDALIDGRKDELKKERFKYISKKILFLNKIPNKYCFFNDIPSFQLFS